MTTMNATSIYTDPAKRHDFVLLFDVSDGNPNGDPDAGNLPRVDPETMQGLVSDVAIKRKVRDYVDLLRGGDERYKIYVQSGSALNDQHQRAYTAIRKESKGTKQDAKVIDEARDWMCANFFDIRAFGAVMTTKVNCGQVRGPLQITFARSYDQIIPLDVSITRIAVTRAEDMRIEFSEDADGKQTSKGKTSEMGRKALVPYGLYRAYGFFNPHFAAKTGADTADLEVFWQALQRMWDIDRSSARGMMSCRGLYVFSHDSPLGNAPAQNLFERIGCALRDGVEAPRQFADYTVSIDGSVLPKGVTLSRLVG